jgi:coatomer subunit beta
LEILLQDGRTVFGRMLTVQEKRGAEKKVVESEKIIVQVDDLLVFREFLKKIANDV